MRSSSPKLPLTDEERFRLRESKIKLKDIARTNPTELSNVSGLSLERARLLCALASFQTIPSIDPRATQWVLDLGYYSLDEIKDGNGSELLNRLEEQYGYWMDPCVWKTLCAAWCTTPIIRIVKNVGLTLRRNAKHIGLSTAIQWDAHL